MLIRELQKLQVKKHSQISILYQMKKYIFLMLCLSIAVIKLNAQGALTGQVFSKQTKDPLRGATIKVHETNQTLIADSNGKFKLVLSNGDYRLSIINIGYLKKDILVNIPYEGLLLIPLLNDTTLLDEVTISTGYQKISKERLTGSVVRVDNSLIERRVSTNILNRLEDVVPGVVFNRSGLSSRKSPMSIRGQSTLFGNTDPLIILNNFPYDGDINNINPNDVEDITILKDASAASIWGARAGNGVVVITTKQGSNIGGPKVNFSSRVTIGEKPDLLSSQIMGSSDYIETEKRLFALNFYRSTELSAARAPLSPVVELLIAKRDGLIDPRTADEQIEGMKLLDVREHYLKYLYRLPFNLQQSLNVMGGNQSGKYYLSAGWDKNLETLRANDFNRVTLTANNSYLFLNKRLELSANVNFNQNNNVVQNLGSANITLSSLGAIYPYAQLVDDSGNSLPIANNYRLSYVRSAEQKGLLDWAYKPLDEIRYADNTTNYRELRGDFGLSYKVIDGLRAKILYQYIYGNSIGRNNRSQETFFTRNLINTYSIINANGSVTRPIPLGGILDQTDITSNSHQLRTQLSYDKQIGKSHYISFLSGYEFKDGETQSRSFRIYGYDDMHATGQLVDYQKNHVSQVTPTTTTLRIPYMDIMGSLTDRFVSYFANGAYTFDSQYNAYASIRLDQSNIFGVNTNQKGIPLWSTGLAWNIDRAGFFKVREINALKLRFSYGYNGNVDRSLSAYTTAQYYAGSTVSTGLPYATIQNPPNPNLRWERVSVMNTGIDFSLFNSRLSGSFDYYIKRGKDLLGATPFPPSTGITSFRGNYAHTKGKGVDISLQSINVKSILNWQTNFIFSYSKDIVTSYELIAANANYLEQGINGGFPLVGKPLYAIYSYKWAGLDPLNGDPMGYLADNISKSYAQIQTLTPVDKLIYNGTSRPLYYGAVRNTVSFKNISLSANISYRLGYYFRKSSISYGGNQGLGGHSDYELRWKNAGDELKTFVPSIPASNNARRDIFYAYSEILVDKGDHIRLQDVNLSYDLDSKLSKFGIKGVKLFVYIDNIGLIWKANDFDIDPDFQGIPPVRTYSFGINLNL